MKNYLLYILSSSHYIRFLQKFSSLKLHIMLNSYQKYFKKNCHTCGTGIRVYNPMSLKGLKYFQIGDNFKFGNQGKIEAWDFHNGFSFNPIIKIGNNVSLGDFCHIGVIKSLTIGNNVLIGANVTIIDHNHGNTKYEEILLPPNERKLVSKGEIKIGNNVWIGENVIILPNTNIGENCIIGANSVVTKDVPKNTIFAGNPAVLIKRILVEDDIE